MNNRQVAAGLREFADIIEDDPDLEHIGSVDIDLFPGQKKHIATWAKALGSCEKFYRSEIFGLRKTLGGPEGLAVSVYVTRGQVCERVQVGTKVIPAQPEREIPVYEWKCPDSVFKE